MFSMRSKDKRVVLIATVLSVFVLMALKWEWDLVTNKVESRKVARAAEQGASETEGDADAANNKAGGTAGNAGAKGDAPVPKTAWGYPLTGDSSFWGGVRIECKKDTGKKFYMKDIEANKGDNQGTFYLAVRGHVLDVTAFRKDHPGGEAILNGAGQDATPIFELYHQPFIANMLSNFCVGKLYPDGA